MPSTRINNMPSISSDLISTVLRIIHSIEKIRLRKCKTLYKKTGKAACPQIQNSYDHVNISIPETNDTVTITNDTAQSMLNISTADQILEPDTETKTLQIEVIQVNSHKWKFRDGVEAYYAEIQDKQFLKEWNNRNIAFHPGDMLKVQLRTERYVHNQILTSGKRTILKVEHPIPLEHQPTFDSLY